MQSIDHILEIILCGLLETDHPIEHQSSTIAFNPSHCPALVRLIELKPFHITYTKGEISFNMF